MSQRRSSEGGKHWSTAVPERRSQPKVQRKDEDKDKEKAWDKNMNDKFGRELERLLDDKDCSESKMMKVILFLMAQSIVGVQRATRELQASTNMKVWKGKAKMPAVAPIRDRYKEYLTEVKETGPEHELGGPQLTLYVKFITVLIENKLEKWKEDGEELKLLKKEKEIIEGMTVEQAMDRVPLFKIQNAFTKPGQDKMVKIKITAYPEMGVMILINTWLCNNTCKPMQGQPAATGQERMMLKVIKKLDQYSDHGWD